MTTVGTPVYGANSNNPFWLASGQPAASPLIVYNSLSSAARQIDLTATANTGSVIYNSVPAATPYGELRFGDSNIQLLLNGQVRQLSDSNGFTTTKALNISNQQTGQTLNINTDVITHVGGASIYIGGAAEPYVGLGENVYQDANGLTVYNNGYYNYSTQAPTDFSFYSTTNAPVDNIQTFSGTTIPQPPGYTAASGYAGYRISCYVAGLGTGGGFTLMDPLYSPVAITLVNSPYNGKAVWLGVNTYAGVSCFLSIPMPAGITPGTTMTLTFNYTGEGTGFVTRNGGLVNSLYSDKTQWRTFTYSWFYAPGDDMVIEYIFTFGSPTATVLNVTNVNVSYAGTSASLDGGIGLDGGVLKLGTSNYLATPGIYITPSNMGFLQPIATDITLDNTQILGASTINATTVNGGDVYTNVLHKTDFSYISVDGDFTFGGTGNIYGANDIQTNSLNCLAGGTGTLDIGSNSTVVNLYNVGGITTNTVNPVGSGNLTIGSVVAPGSYVDLLAVRDLYYQPSYGLMSIYGLGQINLTPACPNATLWYSNAAGLYTSVAISPKKDGTANANVFPAAMGFTAGGVTLTIPPHTSFTLTNGATYGRWDNTASTPLNFNIGSGNFNPASTTQYYQLFPLI
jgi:hypothetical protein